MVGLGDLAGGAFNSFAHGVSADGSVVVGSSSSASGGEAFRWTSEGGMVGLGDLSGGTFQSGAFGVSPDGSVVVGGSSSASGVEAFRWTSEGGMVGLGDLGGEGDTFSGVAYGVSADGSVVVGLSRFGLGSVAFIWDPINGMRDLREVLESDYGLDLTGWTLTTARAISPDGTTIVGDGLNPDGRQEAWFAVVPRAACNDGIDNDSDNLIDLADPNCTGPTDSSEHRPPPPPGCGLGPELALLLSPIWWLRSRRARAVEKAFKLLENTRFSRKAHP